MAGLEGLEPTYAVSGYGILSDGLEGHSVTARYSILPPIPVGIADKRHRQVVVPAIVFQAPVELGVVGTSHGLVELPGIPRRGVPSARVVVTVEAGSLELYDPAGIGGLMTLEIPATDILGAIDVVVTQVAVFPQDGSGHEFLRL